MKTKNLVAAALLVFSFTPGAFAGVISATGNDGGVGFIEVTPPDPNAGSFEIDLVKVYTGAGPMAVAMEIDSTGFYTLHETIVNLSADPWDTFTWLLSAPDGAFFFDVSITGGPFTVEFPEAPSAESIGTVSGGTLVPGAAFTVDITVLITLDSITEFAVIQIPTVGTTIPEPGMIALTGLALLGLGLARRRKA